MQKAPRPTQPPAAQSQYVCIATPHPAPSSRLTLSPGLCHHRQGRLQHLDGTGVRQNQAVKATLDRDRARVPLLGSGRLLSSQQEARPPRSEPVAHQVPLPESDLVSTRLDIAEMLASVSA